MSDRHPFMQPIETAPRDGTLIVVGDPDAGWFPMQWGHIQQNGFFAPGVVGMWIMPDGSMTWTEHGGFGPSEWCTTEVWTTHHQPSALGDDHCGKAPHQFNTEGE